MTVYDASPIKRYRATGAEMEERAEFLLSYADEQGPVTVRQLFYRAGVRRLPGIDKSDSSYIKIQRQVLDLRRAGRMPYENIADATRWMRKPRTYDGVEAAIEHTAQFYRKSLWTNALTYAEVWLEKDALAGVVMPVTSCYDVPLMVTRGFSSETFCYEAIEAHRGDPRPYFVHYLRDFDRAGVDAANAVERTMRRFADEAGVDVQFNTIAVTLEQIKEFNLPTREPKRESRADKNWPHPFACELDAIEPDDLREIVEEEINNHIDQDQLRVLKVAEASEREFLLNWARESRP